MVTIAVLINCVLFTCSQHLHKSHRKEQKRFLLKAFWDRKCFLVPTILAGKQSDSPLSGSNKKKVPVV